jgi:hypothetical protein
MTTYGVAKMGGVALRVRLGLSLPRVTVTALRAGVGVMLRAGCACYGCCLFFTVSAELLAASFFKQVSVVG